MKKVYYGWIVAVAAGFGIACSFSVLVPATLGLLTVPLGREFGWSLQQVVSGGLATTAAMIIVAPFVGAAVDRFGARRLIVLSLLLQSAVLFSFRYVDHSLPLFYARYVALGALASGGTAIAFTKVIANWFRRRRGLALGIALAGTGVGGVAWSLCTSALFSAVGWRDTFGYFAAFLAFVATPILALTVRDKPGSMSLRIDGDDSSRSETGNGVAEGGMSLGQAAKTIQFWRFILVVFMIGFGVNSLMVNLVPIVKSVGDPANMAATIQASLWAAMILGRIVTGMLLDRFFAPRLACVCVLLPMGGAIMFASGASGELAFVAAMLIGFAVGAEVDAFAYMTSRYYGLKHYARIYAVCFSIYAVGGGLGPIATAHLAQTSGGFARALWLLIALMAASSLLLLSFRRYPSWSEQNSNQEDSILDPIRVPR